jgi:lysophospholipase L1-like esterase
MEKKYSSLMSRWGGRCGRSIFLTVLLLGLILTACTKGGPKLAPLPADAVVLAFGDSITYGTGASLEESYPAVLARLTGRTVINAGVPGEVTAEGVVRLPGVLDRYRPALLLLCLGGNDFLRRLDERQAADNIREMVRLAKGKGVDVVLIGVPQLGLAPSPPPFYRQVAREIDVPYEGDILKRILTKKSLKADLIHPNAQGYKVFAEGIATLMKKRGAL